jgi:hypothetical protein
MHERSRLGPVDLEKAGALRAKAEQVDPESQNPNVPPPPPRAQAQSARPQGARIAAALKRWR